MSTSDLIEYGALVMSFLALTVSGWTYRETKRTADANVAMAESSRESAVAAKESAKAAQDALSVEVASLHAARSASLTLLEGRREIWAGPVYVVTLFIRNEGEHAAHNIAVAVEHATGPVNNVSGGDGSISPGKSKPFDFTLTDLPQEPVFTIHVSYRDGLGPALRRFRVRFVGDEFRKWRGKLEPDGDEGALLPDAVTD